MGEGARVWWARDETVEAEPAERSVDPRINRWAADQERSENLFATIERARGTRDRGHDLYVLELEAGALARAARTDAELYAAVRRRLLVSHGIETEKQAERFIEAAVRAYREARGIRDPDWAHLMALGLRSEYEKAQLARRRERVGDITREIEVDPVRQERLAWVDRIDELSRASGLDPAFVEEFLLAYYALNRPRFPGIIDPRGVPFIQLSAGRYGVAYVLKNTITGIGLYEGITGRDILSGEELETWERGLAIALDLIPFVPARVTRPAARATGGAVRAVARSAVRAGRLATEWAIAAVRTARRPEVVLRFIGRLARLPAEGLRRVRGRIRAALRARKELRLASEEQRLLRDVDEAFREFDGPVGGASARSVKVPTARGFIFLSRLQPAVLGRLLDRPLAGAAGRAVRPALQHADDVARGLRQRISAHWDAARPRAGTDAAVRRVFDELKRANPPNPNTWVRARLYDLWRKRAMNRIYRDAALRRELMDQAGIVVGRNPRTRSVSMHIRTRSASGGRTQTPIDFDHAGVGHSSAVSRALNADDYRQLLSTVDPGNLQLMTGRENRNFIEALREAQRVLEQQ
jgi:Pre-toxin TG